MKETLEEAALKYAQKEEVCFTNSFYSFKSGATWQQKQNEKQIETLKEELTYYKRQNESNNRI